MENASVAERLRAALPHAVIASHEHRGDLSIVVQPEALIDVARFLRDEPELRYNFLENLCGVDYLGRDPRFEVVYHLLSFSNHHRICLKVGLPEADPTVDSLTGLWPTANWQEREAYDLFGIIFRGHPSLERILMPDDWEGHPLRKDVPLGYEEVAFTFNQEQIDAHKPYAQE
ncbi:MAG TPA: NADH-quinone oxidoreductase subunit C [Roseiflexaceae bacterium]|nr:NADH-quinone oxidoreductase subunit C [Roseiflexaceae bacterium]HMP39337.1 NADH-quinone oxidoreductase subunit C [Roseiflexaceae bacterium]